MNLHGKTALVTGGSEGIGLAVAKNLLRSGCSVVVLSRDKSKQAKAAKLLSDSSDRLIFMIGDVTQTPVMQQAVAQCISSFGTLDILVNNAGIYPYKPFMDITLEEWDHVMNVNLRSAFRLTQLAAAEMIKQGGGGKIVNIASREAIGSSLPGFAHYSVSKHGLWGLTQASALELARYNIQVNAISAGPTLTPGVHALMGERTSKSALDTPEHVAQVVIAAIAGTMTGQLLPV